jgi:hypothetical protein
MNECDRTELSNALAKLRRRYPEWRFGQLIANVAGWADQNVWDIEDEQLIAAAEEHLLVLAQRNLKTRTQSPEVKKYPRELA